MPPVISHDTYGEIAATVDPGGVDPQSLFDGGGTALYDAIYRAAKEKFLKDRPDHPVRKAIVVVSDGEDNQSEVSRAQAIEMAQRADTRGDAFQIVLEKSVVKDRAIAGELLSRITRRVANANNQFEIGTFGGFQLFARSSLWGLHSRQPARWCFGRLRL